MTTEKMHERYLRFVFLICFPGVLHAQRESCPAPVLDNGYFVLGEENDGKAKLTYACDNGCKPAVEGWWATATCQNGKWSHTPRCIDENDCIPPTIPNAKYTEDANGWYKNEGIIRITCDKGYTAKDWRATARCISGSWSSLPICEKSHDACSAPPKIPHAVIIHPGYQEVFPADSKAQYECEDGYSAEESKKSIWCTAGNWPVDLTCSVTTGPTAGHGGTAVGGTGDSAGRETKPASGGGTGDSAGRQTEPASGGGTGDSAGRETEPASGGSSTTSHSRPQTTIDNCGPHPNVPNGDVVQRDPMFLKYQCNAYYRLVGPDTVVCYIDGTWSQLPTCTDTSCVFNTALYAGLGVKKSGVEYIKDGERKLFRCNGQDYYIYVRCINKYLYFNSCCYYPDIQRGLCQ